MIESVFSGIRSFQSPIRRIRNAGEAVEVVEQPASETTNLCSYSNNFNGTWWFQSSPVSFAQDAVDPWGTPNNAWTMTMDSASGAQYILKNALNSMPTSVTFSIFAKAGTCKYIELVPFGFSNFGDRFFDLENGTIGGSIYTALSSTITPVGGNGWYRLSVTVPDVGADNSGSFDIYACNTISQRNNVAAGKYLYLYGCQVEEGTSVTDYNQNET